MFLNIVNLIMRSLSYNLCFLFSFIVLTLFTFNNSYSKGDLTRQNAISIEVSLKGSSGEFHYYEPSILRFETGKLYKLKLKNLSDSKHYFTSKEFANSIFTRKIQVNKDEEKIAEIKGNILEVEIFPNNTLEWWFVPIKTGIFEDLYCKVIDNEINKSHAEMGMRGKIIIE